jgi:putative transcriptional regulator
MRIRDSENLGASVKQAGSIRRGKINPGRVSQFSPADVKAIRARLKKSQSEFAMMIGVSIATLQNWEQGRRSPHGPARALLKIAAEKPRAVIEALTARRSPTPLGIGGADLDLTRDELVDIVREGRKKI